MDVTSFLNSLKKRGEVQSTFEETCFMVEVKLKTAKISFEFIPYEVPTAKKYASFTIKMTSKGSKTKRSWQLDNNCNFYKSEVPKTSVFDLLMWIESQFESNSFSSKSFIRGISCNEFKNVIDIESHETWMKEHLPESMKCTVSQEQEPVFDIEFEGLNIKITGVNTSRYFLGFLMTEEFPDDIRDAFAEWVKERRGTFLG